MSEVRETGPVAGVSKYGLEQVGWSLSNIVLVVGVAGLGTSDRIAPLLALTSVFALQTGIVRAGYYEAREVGSEFPKLTTKLRAGLQLPTLLAGLFFLIAMSDWVLSLMSFVGGFVLLIAEVARSRALDAGNFRQLLIGHACWFVLVAGAALAGLFGELPVSEADVIILAWLLGAAIAAVCYRFDSPNASHAVEKTTTSSIGSVSEYLASGGTEQIALIVAAALLHAGALAHLRFALAVLGPLNFAFAGWRAGAISGDLRTSRVPRGAVLALCLVGGVYFVVLQAIDPSYLEFDVVSLILLLPIGLLARASIGVLAVSSIAGRVKRGFWKTARLRSLPSIGLLVVPFFIRDDPGVVFFVVLLAATFALAMVMLDERSEVAL